MILVDTGLPAGTPEEVPDENSMAFTGKDICSYMEAFAALGYKQEQVTKILLTHKHTDHSGEIRSFPNAKIYVGGEEVSAAELQDQLNISTGSTATATTPTTAKNGDSFIVRVKISNLNIRSGAGLSYQPVGFCPVGSYTIVATTTADGLKWGKLKSGVGWIALKYTERV